MSDRCRTCRAEVIWAKTVPGDKTMPLDVAEVPAGTAGALVVIYGASDRAFAYSPAELVERMASKRGVTGEAAWRTIEADYPWHVSHFSTCPDAGQHRRNS